MSDKMYNHSRFILDRLDRQYDKVNYKINLYLAVNAAIITILTFLIKEVNPLSGFCCLSILYSISVILVIGLAVWTIVLLIGVASPFLPENKDLKIDNEDEDGIPKIAIKILKEEKSSIYFDHIVTHKGAFFKNYVELFENKENTTSDYSDRLNADILSQIYILSQGLVKRNKSLMCIGSIMKATMILTAVLLLVKLFFI